MSAPRVVSLVPSLTESVLAFPPPTLTVKPRANSAVASWAASNQAGVTGYVVTAVPGGQTCRTSGTRCTVRGLVTGKRYRFSVQALNEYGAGAATLSTRVRVR